MRKVSNNFYHFFIVKNYSQEIINRTVILNHKSKFIPFNFFISKRFLNTSPYKLTHSIPLQIYEKETKPGNKQKYINKNIIRENFIEAWFQNVCNLIKSDPQFKIDWMDTNSDLVLPIVEKFHDKWPLIILSYLVTFSKRVPGLLDNAMNLIAYVKTLNLLKNQTILDVTTMAILFNQGDETHYDKVISIYEDLKRNDNIFDVNLCSTLIKMISKTPYWKDCFNFLEMIKLSSVLQSGHITPVMIACTKHNDLVNKGKLMDILVELFLMPTDEYFEFMLKHNSETLFMEMQTFNWIINENIANVIKQSFQGLDRHIVADVSIKDGKCTECNLKLPLLRDINEKDFQDLKSEFDAKVFCKKSDIFINSSPLEIENFKQFCLENSDFDVVIDALNVRGRLSQKASKKEKDHNLLQVIKYFENKRLKVLVLSRKHVEQRKSSSATWFFTDNLSADDQFGLFVALRSKSRGAFYVSSDMLRDHSYLLGPRLANVFKIWQRGHQIMFDGLYKKGLPILRWPEKHDMRSHICKESVHIPYKNKDLLIKFQLADKWLCIQRK